MDDTSRQEIAVTLADDLKSQFIAFLLTTEREDFADTLDKKLNDEEKKQYAQLYGNYCRERLCDKNLLIKNSINFIKENHKNFNFHLVSASDEKELIYLCSNLDIKKYFKSISGSPVNKIENIKKLLKSNNYNESKCCLIGDSINDKFASIENNISFFGFNNKQLIKDSEYIQTFKSLQ